MVLACLKLSFFFLTQPNDLFVVWLSFIAELIVKPTHQELKFLIGKVNFKNSEFLLVIAFVGISCLVNKIKNIKKGPVL